MLRDYFDQIYVINLDSRVDRLEATDKEFQKIGAPFIKVSGVDGYKENVPAPPYEGSNPMYWNQGAAGLLKSTEKVLLHALENKHKKILICEDDVEFAENINEQCQYLEMVPRNWDMFLFGAMHIDKATPVNDHISQVKYAYCLHCYAVNITIMEYYLYLVQNTKRELDRITADIIQPRGKTFCFPENVASQRASFSDIQKQDVDYYYLRKPDKW